MATVWNREVAAKQGFLCTILIDRVAVKRGSTVYSIACCVGKQVTSTYFQFKTDVADSQIFFTLGP